MPKQVIVIMDDHYPFGQCEQSTNENTRVLVRKIYEVSVQQKNKLLEKANILKRLKCQQLIKLQSVLQEEESIHFLFEYVPIRLETWISNINDQFIQNFRDQVIKFSSYLANNFIKIEFKLKNIGMDHNYGAKYFLDPSLIYDPTLNKEKLKSQYIRDISNLFRPYIESSQEEEKPTYTQNQQQQSASQQQAYQKPTVQNKNSISPPTYEFDDQPQQKDQANANNNKTKEKLQKYYQHMNASMDVENQKILKEFMDVLDDEEEEEHVNLSKGITASQQQSRSAQYQSGFDNDKKPSSKPQLPPMTQSSQQRNIFQSVPQKQQAFNDNITTSKQASMMLPPKMTKNSQMVPEQVNEEQVIWKDGDDLQDRIKKAIQNSKSIINRFKTIKQGR